MQWGVEREKDRKRRGGGGRVGCPVRLGTLPTRVCISAASLARLKSGSYCQSLVHTTSKEALFMAPVEDDTPPNPQAPRLESNGLQFESSSDVRMDWTVFLVEEGRVSIKLS